MRINQPIVGFVLGAIAPVIGLLIVYLIFGHGIGLAAFVKYIFANTKQLSKMLSLSLLANIVPFLIFTNKRLDYAARGVFIATMIYAVTIVMLKIL